MAGSKEIRTQVASIKGTQKITKAMEMVAASKMRKAQDRMLETRPYADKIQNVVNHLSQAHPEYHHPYLEQRDAKRVGLIVISTDRGLCGGLNINLFKSMIHSMKERADAGAEIDICAVGSKGAAFFNNYGGNVVAAIRGIGDKPAVEDVVGGVKVMLDGFADGKLDKLFLVTNEFVNTMTQKPVIEQLLPLQAAEDKDMKHHWDYIYEPDARDLLDGLLARYIESQVYQAVVENNACEQAARMIAMKSATDNAGELIDELQLVYNKARQAAITQELSEIVGGAAAL